MSYALYHHTNIESGKTYVGIYKYAEDREYITSSKNEAFWNDYDAGLLFREILHVSDEATIRHMESEILADAKNRGITDSYYNLCFGAGPTGIMYTDEVRAKMSVKALALQRSGMNNPMYGKTGIRNPNAKLANVYERHTHELVAEGVSLSEYSRDNGYHASGLPRTARADHSEPSTTNNSHFYKGLYAIYQEARL